MKLIGFLGLAGAVTVAVACGSNGADGDSGSGGPSSSGGGATKQGIADCKHSCDQLKLFDCNDSQDQADCYKNCGEASSNQIELFVACVTNDICDPSCSTHIQPSGNPGGSGGPSGGDSVSTCASDGCGGGDGCAEACQHLQFFDCIDAATFDTCSGLCLSATSEDKATFASCVESSSASACQSVDCYYQFDPNAVPGPTPQQIADCKKSCENLAFFHCITGSEAAACAAACDQADKTAIEAFLICTTNPTDCEAASQCF